MRLLPYTLIIYACGVMMGSGLSELIHDDKIDTLLLEFRHQAKQQLDACNKHWKQAIIDAELE